MSKTRFCKVETFEWYTGYIISEKSYIIHLWIIIVFELKAVVEIIKYHRIKIPFLNKIHGK